MNYNLLDYKRHNMKISLFLTKIVNNVCTFLCANAKHIREASSGHAAVQFVTF